jgi:hypothetical protein
VRNATDRDLVTDVRVAQAIRHLDHLNEWLACEYGQLTDWQRHDLEVAFKRIQYKTEKAA